MRSYPKVVVGSAWKDVDLPWIQTSNSWRRIAQGWVNDGDEWRPVWDLITLPKMYDGSVWTDGRWGQIPGTIWGNTNAYNTFDMPTVREVIGIQIEISIAKEQGSFHGNGGRFGVGTSYPPIAWEAGPWTGVQTSPYIPCSFAAGQQIRVWCYGNDNDGDGKTISYVKIVNVFYRGND